MSSRPLRIFRSPGSAGRLTLHDGTGLWDFTDFLRRHGQPVDLVDLFEADYLHGSNLDKLLPGGEVEWKPAEVETGPDGTPAQVGVPFNPRSVGKILALGKNFRAHAEEFNEEVPTEPLFFNKLPETMRGHNQTTSPPLGYGGRLDYEGELAVIIGRTAKNIDESDAAECVAGYSVANDMTLRTTQGEDREKSYPWFRAKNFDGACPIGPCVALAEQFDTTGIEITTHVNGELRQSASCEEMLVSIPQAISYLSKHFTLHPGDILLMGTPAGVGPLEEGDEVVCAITGIGELRTRIGRES